MLFPNYVSKSQMGCVLTHRCWSYGFETPVSARIGTARIRRGLVLHKPVRRRAPVVMSRFLPEKYNRQANIALGTLLSPW